MSLVKPQLRGLLASQIKKHLIIATILSLSAGISWKVFVMDARKKKYAEFYKNYDAEADYQRMKALGIFRGFSKD